MRPRMVKKSIGLDFRKNKSVFIAAALIVGRYYPKKLRNLRHRLHPGPAETSGHNGVPMKHPAPPRDVKRSSYLAVIVAQESAEPLVTLDGGIRARLHLLRK